MDERGAERDMNTILVATDFSEPADRALRAAIDLARGLGDVVELVHVHPIGVASVPPMLDMAPVPPSAKQVASAETAMAARVRVVELAGLTCESFVAFGAPAEEVVRRAADRRPRLIVVGTHGGGALAHVLVGSVAERILHRAPCPVLVVPPPRG
jgi:nucleotide-binding universal stress UspA family protein